MHEPDRRLDAKGVICHVLIDGWPTVSPRFVFQECDDAVQGEFGSPRASMPRLDGRVHLIRARHDPTIDLVPPGIIEPPTRG